MDTLLNEQRKLVVERVDDLPLLIALQQKIGLAEIIDAAIPRHGLHLGLSIGQLVVGYNTFILSQGDHRKVAVEDWAVEHQAVLSDSLGQPLRSTEFTDDRLGHVLSYLSDDESWRKIEAHLWQNTVMVYHLVPERVRLDATRFSGHHTPTDEGLMQYGYNRETHHQSQVKLMGASVDCGVSGHFIATSVMSGESADDPLYLPIIGQVRQTLSQRGLLYMGDSKMSAIETRGELAHGGDFYLVPLAKVGQVAKDYDQWVEAIVSGHQQATLIYDGPTPETSCRLIAAGYQTTREQSVTLPCGQQYTWTERILVVRSFEKANKQYKSLQARIQKAKKALLALTPETGQGKRQIRTEAQLHQKAQAILSTHDVASFVRYEFRREETTETKYVGPGRGGPDRQKRQVVTVRYEVTGVEVDKAAVSAASARMGFRVYATNHSDKVLPIDESIRLYRAAPRIERHFHLFKSMPIRISPLYVRNDDQIKGLCRLLSLCVRLLTLIEIVVRRGLAQAKQAVAGLYAGQPNRQTAQPTATQLLGAFSGINRVGVHHNPGVIYHTTPLTSLQLQILSLLQIPPCIYQFDDPPSGNEDSAERRFLNRLAGLPRRLIRWFRSGST